MASINCSSIIKSYSGDTVVNDLDLQIDDHEFVVFLGPSGCGKSTILRMIAGLEDVSGGTITIGGVDVTDLPPGERDVAMVFQSYALYPHMTVADNITFGLKRIGVPKAEREARLQKTAELLGISELLDRKPRYMSGGQQQRVAMARAMIKTPKVFLFDEPLSNLDAKLREKLRTEIRKIHMNLKTTTIFVTHDQMEAMTIADKIVLLRGGKIEQQGSPTEIFDRPATRFVADFIGTPSMNFVNAVVVNDPDGFMAQFGSLQLPLLTPRFSGLKLGDEIELGLRPSRMSLAPKGTQGSISGEVILVEHMGSEGQVIVKADQYEFSFMSEDFATLTPGSDVAFTIAPEHIHVFDRQSGQSLLSPESKL